MWKGHRQLHSVFEQVLVVGKLQLNPQQTGGVHSMYTLTLTCSACWPACASSSRALWSAAAASCCRMPTSRDAASPASRSAASALQQQEQGTNQSCNSVYEKGTRTA
jgi:hypothetical protein